VAAARVILVSDSHLSASAPQARANWDAVVGYVGACHPDLVIHLGNHDIGDNPSPGGPAGGGTVDAARRQRWLVLGSALEAEDAQWSWLEEEEAGRLGGRPPVALITHKPITTGQTELAAAPSYRFRPADARERLARLFGSLTLAAAPPAQQELVEPGGLEQHTLTVDLPDPYHG